jgi:uncharacterized membrane protein
MPNLAKTASIVCLIFAVIAFVLTLIARDAILFALSVPVLVSAVGVVIVVHVHYKVEDMRQNRRWPKEGRR